MKKIFFVFCFVTICASMVFAESVSLEEVRLLALANSRSLAKYNLSLRSSLLDDRSQLYNMLPSVSASYSASMNYLDRDYTFVNPIDTFNSGINFSLTQTLFEGGKNLVLREISAIATESLRKDILAEYFNVLDSADNAYYAVLEAAATLEAEEASLETALSGLAIAEIRQESGMINIGDYLKALADKESRENSRNQARRSLALNITKLRSLTGLTELPHLEQIDFSNYMALIQYLGNITDEEADALYGRLLSVVFASNPSLASSALNMQRAELNLSNTKRDFAPTVTATIFSGDLLSYSRAGGLESGTNSRGGIAITGTIPLDFWVKANRINKDKLAVESAALDYVSAESNLETELQSSLLNTLSYAGSALSSQRSLEYTEKHFEFVMERYRLSQSSISDLGDASSMLINSRNSYIKSCYGFLQSLSKLRSLGAMDEECLIGLFQIENRG